MIADVRAAADAATASPRSGPRSSSACSPSSRASPGVEGRRGDAAAPRRLAELLQRRGQAGAAARPAPLRRHRARQPRTTSRSWASACSRGASSTSATATDAPRGVHRRRELRAHPLAGREPARQARQVRGARRQGQPVDGGRRPGGPRQELRRRRGVAGGAVPALPARAPAAASRSWSAPTARRGRGRRRDARGACAPPTPTSRSTSVRPLDELVAERSAERRLAAQLIGVFADGRAGARRGRHLRRHVVRGGAAHAGDRHPHGARRRARSTSCRW